MTRPDLALLVAVFVCVACALPAAMSGWNEVPRLDDPDASGSAAVQRSLESAGSAILELLREARSPEMAPSLDPAYVSMDVGPWWVLKDLTSLGEAIRVSRFPMALGVCSGLRGL